MSLFDEPRFADSDADEFERSLLASARTETMSPERRSALVGALAIGTAVVGAQAAVAVPIWPPGSRAKRCRRCLVFEIGYSATTVRRSMLFRPNPTTSNGREFGGGILNGSLTSRIVAAPLRAFFTGWRGETIGAWLSYLLSPFLCV